jgi:hypothetical protein
MIDVNLSSFNTVTNKVVPHVDVFTTIMVQMVLT